MINCIEKGCNNERMIINSTSKSGKKYSYLVRWCSYHWGLKYANNRHEEKYLTRAGYVIIRVPGGGRIFEHRYVMEQKLGRKLQLHESIHHKDGVKDNNQIDNLELWVGGIKSGQRATDIKCPHCGKSYA